MESINNNFVFKSLFDYPKYRGDYNRNVPFLPMSRKEMDELGWDSCDVILVTGDAYVDHPSFAMALLGRFLEHYGYRVGIISQPDWRSRDDFMKLGRPNLFYGVSSGNMDSMVNRYTADRKLRHDDAYTPGNVFGKRPDRATTVYTQRCRESYHDVPIVIGGIEASLRRVAHYDYWSETVKRSIIFDAKADLILFGMGERSILDVAHRLASGEKISEIRNLRGSGFIVREPFAGWKGIDARNPDRNLPIKPLPNPYSCDCETDAVLVKQDPKEKNISVNDFSQTRLVPKKEYILMPSFDDVKNSKTAYAQAAHIFHGEVNPYCARALLQYHGDRAVWLNPPPIPLSTEEMDLVYSLPFRKLPHPAYKEPIPAYDMIKFSISTMRGCFGGCAFCSIVAHEGKIIQSRSPENIIREVEHMRDHVPGFTGVISDLGGPSANMYQLNCRDPKAQAACRRQSCLYPDVCRNMDVDQSKAINLYRQVRQIPGIKKVVISSGIRLDLAILDVKYIREIVNYHVGGYLKIAPEHTEPGPLNCMMKPGMETYNRFVELFQMYTREAGKEQYIIPYFISAHPGTTNLDMIHLAQWLKKHNFRVDQVQNFYPTPMAVSTTMYYTGFNPIKKIDPSLPPIFNVTGEIKRRVQKAILRYHDPENWDLVRTVLKELKLENLIGNRAECLVPPAERKSFRSVRSTYRQDLASGKFDRQKSQNTRTSKGKNDYNNPGVNNSRNKRKK